jgi:aryl-alcohol dehydrogenase-like predicted oxidoreductase
LDNFNKRGKLLQYAKQCNKKIQARSIFLQGLFFKDPDTFPIKLASLKRNVATLRDIARSKGISINALALNYVIWNPFIDFVLFGVDTIEQLKENIGAILPEFNSELFENINAIDVKENELLYPMNWKG